MPPKQKMGSITHNSAEVNRGSSKGGMLSKLKGSFSSKQLGAAPKTSSKRQDTSKSVQSKSTMGTGAGTQASSQHHSKVKSQGSSSFTIASGSVASSTRGVPTSITALVDAASVLTDEVTIEPDPTQHPPQDFRPPQAQSRRRVTVTHGTTDAASRALGNLNVGGAPMDNPRVPMDQGMSGGMPRANSAEWGRHSGEPGHNSGGEWGRQQHEMVQAPDTAGYNNYSFDRGYDGYDNGGDEGDYYDGRGGGIFDESYMRPSGNRTTSVSAHQPPPPNRGYNRNYAGNSEGTPHPYNRRATDASHESYRTAPSYLDNRRGSNVSHESYGSAPPNLGSRQPYRGPSEEADPRLKQQPYRRLSDEADPRTGYRNPPSGNGGRYGNKAPPEPGRNSADNKPRQRADRRPSLGHNSGPTPARNNVVNNTGRDSGQTSPASSLTGPASGKHNPGWFTEQHSNSTDQIQNKSSRSRRYQDDDDDDRTMATMATKDQALRPGAMLRAKEKNNPTGDVTIIFTDVQGSTSFWETCPTDMKKATDIHDIIMRQCYTNHSGYEISTEGDSFNLAFQHPVDALAFALQAQLKLYKADWPEGILNHPDGKDEQALKFRGFRVRFGIHHGPTKSRVHEMTGRNVYSGEGVKVAKAVEGLCHGGQILTTMETWKAVSGMAERYLGRPQVSDCGEHLLFESKIPNIGSSGYTTTRYTRRIMQLVPSSLAFDFFEARGRRDVPTEDGKMGFEIKDASSVTGRLFPPLTSKRQLTTCFLNAPYANGRVTICFVYTVGLDDIPDNRTKNLGILAKLVRKKMLMLNPPGYECQEDNGCWMLAFDRMAHAVTFGLHLKSAGIEAGDLVGTVDREAMFKVGILSGPFTSMGPHKTTGMADYFGPIVNRSARVASNCEAGQVCVGIPLSNGVTADPPDFGPTVNVQLQGIKKLKGITIDMAIFTCIKRMVETPYR